LSPVFKLADVLVVIGLGALAWRELAPARSSLFGSRS